MTSMNVMTFTTLPVKPETLARLKRYKMGGASYDKVLNELMDDHPPASFLQEHLRRMQEEESVPWGAVKDKLGL
jgi:hypothetical protein